MQPESWPTSHMTPAAFRPHQLWCINAALRCIGLTLQRCLIWPAVTTIRACKHTAECPSYPTLCYVRRSNTCAVRCSEGLWGLVR